MAQSSRRRGTLRHWLVPPRGWVSNGSPWAVSECFSPVRLGAPRARAGPPSQVPLRPCSSVLHQLPAHSARELPLTTPLLQLFIPSALKMSPPTRDHPQGSSPQGASIPRHLLPDISEEATLLSQGNSWPRPEAQPLGPLPTAPFPLSVLAFVHLHSDRKRVRSQRHARAPGTAGPGARPQVLPTYPLREGAHTWADEGATLGVSGCALAHGLSIY